MTFSLSVQFSTGRIRILISFIVSVSCQKAFEQTEELEKASARPLSIWRENLPAQLCSAAPFAAINDSASRSGFNRFSQMLSKKVFVRSVWILIIWEFFCLSA